MEYDRALLFTREEDEARLSYGLDSGDMHCWLVSYAEQGDFPDTYATLALALAWLVAQGYALACPVVDRIDAAGYVTEERRPYVALDTALEWLIRR